jgi:hypothetical protein
MAITIPLWPVTLPPPDRDGYSYSLDFGLLRTPFEGGYIRQRRTAFGMPGFYALTFRMNTAHLGILQKFLDEHGYAWFAMDLVSGAARYVRPASDCLMHRVRFTSNPLHEMIGPNLWRVTLQAEVQSMRDPSADAAGNFSFALVDDVKPELTDDLIDWDLLTL